MNAGAAAAGSTVPTPGSQRSARVAESRNGREIGRGRSRDSSERTKQKLNNTVFIQHYSLIHHYYTHFIYRLGKKRSNIKVTQSDECFF